MPILNTCDNATYKWLCRTCKDGSGEPTHTAMTGGRYYVSDGEKADTLQCLIKDALGIARRDPGNVQLPCLAQLHTQVFPFYVDMDIKVPKADLSKADVVRMVARMAGQLARFWPDNAEPFVCVVCRRTGNATSDSSGAAIGVEGPPRYKHGLHVHWPGVRVDVDMARQIRVSMIAGLDRDTWLETLGIVHPDWESILDEAVYSTGLRVVGCPKAMPCPECKSAKSAKSCSVCTLTNGNRVVDPRYYDFYVALAGVCESDELAHWYNANLIRLVKDTSVRVDGMRNAATVTAGYRVYDGCPPVPLRNGKRPVRGKTGDVARLERCFRTPESEVTDPAKLKIFRKQVQKHSEHYAESSMRVRVSIAKDGVTVREYRVTLSGDGAKFCLNKGSAHNSQNVYMVVYHNPSSKLVPYASQMRCWCRCNTPRGDAQTMCAGYRSGKKVVDNDDVHTLFPKPQQKAAAVAATSKPSWSSYGAHNTALWDERLDEAVREMQEEKRKRARQ